MSGRFATKWDVLFGSVLIGVDRTTGVFSGTESTPGQQVVAVWSEEAIATDALHVESWELRRIAVRELLTLLPPGIGFVIDPEHASGMTATASYVANLKRYVPAFPVGSEVRLAAWDGLPEAVRAAVVQASSHDDTVRELHAFSYTVDDSPPLGCLVYVAVPGADATGVPGRIDAAVTASADVAALGVATVHVLTLDEVPEEVRAALGDRFVIHRPRRSRLWRR
ncbi:MAG: hypothetical protein JWP56_242 [Aeromicrobium sp.]|nr:hypothetical protein [Aeromicrobium sp.]